MADAAVRVGYRMTSDDFVRWCEDVGGDVKYELVDGVPVAMAGGSADNDTIATNIAAALHGPLRTRGCRTHRDLLLRSPVNDGFAAFPDVFVRCGPPVGQRTWVDDALAVFEILSPSTIRADRGYKHTEYRLFPTMRHYVMVYPGEPRVEIWSRGDDGSWLGEPDVVSDLGDRVVLPALDLSLAMADIYDGTMLRSVASA